MNGPEHYAAAEDCLSYVADHSSFPERHQLYLAKAQVHATLALAAAVAGLDASEGPGGGSTLGRRPEDADAWDVALTPPERPDLRRPWRAT